jgi:uncharacterized protein (TIGR03067 family)
MAQTSATAVSSHSLDGRWKVIYSEVEGEMVPDSIIGTAFLEIQSHVFKVEKNGVIEYEGRLTTNPSTYPNEIILIYEKSAKPGFLGGPRPGIYQVEGNTFKTCFGMIGHSFPKELSTYPGSQSALSVHLKEVTGTSSFARVRPLPNGLGGLTW